ncbi:MAG: hypothetical protein FJX67_12920 [Alphaproteobacteria bacterium]|nr:hypothetical protein [Alphaproteobacteria bacterium]
MPSRTCNSAANASAVAVRTKPSAGLSEGDKAPDIRLVATMMRFQVGPMVSNKSGMRTVVDLKGKRAPYGFNQATLFQFVMEAFLSSGRLTWNDVTQVPHVGLSQHWDSFKAGKIDVVIAAAGTATIQEMDTVIDGGVRYITMDNSPDGLARLQKIMPGSFLDLVESRPRASSAYASRCTSSATTT